MRLQLIKAANRLKNRTHCYDFQAANSKTLKNTAIGASEKNETQVTFCPLRLTFRRYVFLFLHFLMLYSKHTKKIASQDAITLFHCSPSALYVAFPPYILIHIKAC